MKINTFKNSQSFSVLPALWVYLGEWREIDISWGFWGITIKLL